MDSYTLNKLRRTLLDYQPKHCSPFCLLCSFSASPFVLFSKLGFYPVSVQGVENDPQNNRYWLIKYAPLCPEDAEEDAGDDSGYGPVGELELELFVNHKVFLHLSTNLL